MACDSLYFLPSEIARLVLGYLQLEGYSKTYKNFVKECPHLSEYVSFMKKGQYYPLTINGLSLMQILEEYGSLRVAETSRKVTPNPTLSSLWCQFDSVVDNIKKRVASNSSLVYKGNEKQQSRTRMQMVERRRNQIKATITNTDPDIIQPHRSRTTIASLVVTQDKTDSDYSLSQPASPSDCGRDDNESDEMSIDDSSETVMELPASQPSRDISSNDLGHNKTLPSPRSANQASGSTYQNSSEKCNVSECSTIKSQTELTGTQVPVASFEPESATHADKETSDAPGSPARSVALVPSLKTPVKHNTTQEPLLEKSPRRKRPPKRKPQGELRRQNKSDSSVVHGIGSHNESSNSTDGSALENSFPQILEHIMNDPLLPHKLAENINKSLHPEVIPDPGTPAALPPVDVVPESPFMGRSLEDILDQQETQMPASSINGIIELTEKDPNFEWLFSAGVCYLDEATHDRDFTDHKSRSNGLQSSAKSTTQQPQPHSSGCKVDSGPASSMSFDGMTSDNIHFTPPTNFMPISDDTDNNLFKISMPNFSHPQTSNGESFHSLPQYTTSNETASANQFPVTDSMTLLHQSVASSISALLPVTTCYSASQTFTTSSIQSVTMCVTAQPLETAITSHEPITSKISSRPITTAVTSIQPITSSFSSECIKETVESTLTSPHGFPVLSLRSSINDDDLPDPLSSFTIQSPVKSCMTSECCTNKEKETVASATYSSFVSGMGEGQHSSTPNPARSNSLVLPCMTSITSSAEFTQYSSASPTSSQMVFAKPHSTVPTISPKSLPTVNLKSLLDKLEAKAKGEIVEIDLPTKPSAKPSTKCRGRKKNNPPKKTSSKRVQPKPLSPSAGANWSSELSALVKITSPEKSTPPAIQRSNVKKTCVTRSNSARISDVNSNQTVPQTRTRKIKTKKGNETVMAVLSPSGSCVHHVPVLEVNSLSEVADAKDLVPMGQLIPTTLPAITSSPVTMATTQTSLTSQPQSLSSQSNTFFSMPLSSPPPETSSLQMDCTSSVVVTSTCLPFVQTDAPQTPPTTSCHTEYPSMPDLCGTQPSLPVPAATCDRPRDIQLDHASVLSDAYSADRDFLESPCSDIGTGEGSTPTDNLIETCVTSMNEDLNRYCGIPIDKLTQRDIHVRPLDFSSQVPQTSQIEVSSPIRQPSFGRGKRTPATNKKKIGRPPQRRSTRGKSQFVTNDDIISSPTSKDATTGPSQSDMTPSRTGTSLEKFESSADSFEGPPSQQPSDTPLRGKASQDNSFGTPSRKVKITLAETPHQGRNLYNEPVCTTHQDFEYNPAGTPNQLTESTPTRTEDIPSKGDTSQRQVLTLGNVGALSLQEVVNSPSLHDDMTSRDSVLSLQATSSSLHNTEKNSHKKTTELTTDISDLKLKDHYSNKNMENQEEIRTSHSVMENENIAESEVNSAVLSIQNTTTSVEVCTSSSVNIAEKRDMNAIDMKPSSPIPDTREKIYSSSQDTLEQPSYSSGQRPEEVIKNNQQSSTPTEVKDKSHWSPSEDTVRDQQTDLSVQSAKNSQREQTVIQSEMTRNRTHSDASYSQSVNSDLNTCSASNTTTNNQADMINPTEGHDTQQPQGNINQSQDHVINQSQDHVINQSQGHVINQSQDYQNVSTITSTNILEDAMQQVFSASDSQQTFFSSNPILTETQVTANKQPAPSGRPTSQMCSSSTPVVSQTQQLIVFSPLPTQTVLSSTAPTTMIHSAAPVLTHSKFAVKSSAPVLTPATFIVTSPTYPVVVNSPAPLASHSQFVLNSPVTPLMVKSPATPLIVNSPATPQVVHSPAAVMATAPYKSVCSPAQHKVSSRAPTPQMEPADFIPDRSGTIYVTPNVLAQMSCEKGLVVQQERAVTTSSIVPCPSAGPAVDKCVTDRPDVGQSPHGQYQSDQDIFVETTDEEVAEPSQVLSTPSKVATVTEVSHDIAKIPSLFDTKDGHNQVLTQSGNTSPHCSKDRHSPRYFSALSNSNDTPVCDPVTTMEAYPVSPNSGEENLQKDPYHSALPNTTNHVLQQSDSDEDIDILGDWDHDLSAEEINTASITEHTISHDSLSSDFCSPSKKSAWQAGFATKPSSTTSAFIRKILEQKNTRQTSEKKSPSCTEKVSLKTQTASQKMSPVSHKTPNNSDAQSAQNRPISSDQHTKERTPRRVQVITLSKEVSKVSKDSQNAVQSARGPFKHPQELTPRKTSHSSGKLTSHVKHSVSNEKTSSSERSAEKEVSSHQQYVTPPKKRFTASLKSGDGLYFVSETQGSQSTYNHSYRSDSHNSSPSPHRNRKSTLVPRKDIDSIHTTKPDNKSSDNYRKSPSHASGDHRTSSRTSKSPSHKKTFDKTAQSPSRHKSSEKSSQKQPHKTSERTLQSPSGHRTTVDRTSESPSRCSENLERVNASPNIRRKVFETRDKRTLGKSEDSTSHMYRDHDNNIKSVERGHTSSSVRQSSSSSSYHRISGASNTATTQQRTSPTPKRGHKRREDSYPAGEIRAKRAKKSNKLIDLTKLDVDRFLNSDVYIKGILEK